MKFLYSIVLYLLLISGIVCSPISDLSVVNSSLLNADLTFGVVKEKSLHIIALTKTLLEIQTSKKNIDVSKISEAATNDSVNNNSELVGNWGTLNSAKVNWRHESSGTLLVTGINKGYGLELREDGSFLQTTVVTSGKPNYRVFVSTSGNWQVKEDQIWFYPDDRHYRKWENEIIMIDEHSVPKSYFVFWRMSRNDLSRNNCLYIRYDSENEFRELCNE